MTAMRVLFVNWVDWRDAQGRGGGVAVYQRNMAAALAGSGVQPGWLAAGLAQDLRPGPARWQARKGAPGHWEIVNSAVLAPGQLAWDSPAALADPGTEAAGHGTGQGDPEFAAAVFCQKRAIACDIGGFGTERLEPDLARDAEGPGDGPHADQVGHGGPPSQ